MDVDTNDVKIVVRTSLQLFMKSCVRHLKNHPLVFGLSLAFFSSYIFLPHWSNICFYTCPLAICITIFLRGRLENKYQDSNMAKPKCVKDTSSLSQTRKFPPANHGAIKISRPRIEVAMSRRTFRKGRYSNDERDMQANTYDDLHKMLFDEFEMLMKIQEENDSSKTMFYDDDMLIEDSKKDESSPSNFTKFDDSIKNKGDNDDMQTQVEEMRESSTSDLMKHNKSNKGSIDDGSMQMDLKEQRECPISNVTKIDNSNKTSDDEDQEGSQRKQLKFSLEWKEDNQKNLMDLGSSEAERNKRLESLMQKRRARKQLSMQPQRYYREIGYHVDQSKFPHARDLDDIESQPGSAPSKFLRARKKNPYDIPYDPSEERPILTGGSFSEDFFTTQAKDIHFCKHQSFNYGAWFMGDLNDELMPLDIPRPSGLIRQSTYHVESDVPDRPIPLPPKAKDWKKLDEVNQKGISTSNEENTLRDIGHLRDKLEDLEEPNKKHYTNIKSEKKEDNLYKDSTSTVTNKLKTLGFFDNEEDKAVSTFSFDVSSLEDIVHTMENETFKNQVRKEMNCLVPKVKAIVSEKEDVTSSLLLGDLFNNSNLSPTKMEERSFYTKRYHVPTNSMASDMFVELSKTSLDNGEPNSPNDKESLVFDEDVDKDINSGDEELHVASSKPIQFEEYGIRLGMNDKEEQSTSRLKSSSVCLNGTTQPMLDIDHVGVTDEKHQILQAQDGSSSISLTYNPLDNYVQGESRFCTGNLKDFLISDIDSPTNEEFKFYPREPNNKESEKSNKYDDTSLEALNLINVTSSQKHSYASHDKCLKSPLHSHRSASAAELDSIPIQSYTNTNLSVKLTSRGKVPNVKASQANIPSSTDPNTYQFSNSYSSEDQRTTLDEKYSQPSQYNSSLYPLPERILLDVTPSSKSVLHDTIYLDNTFPIANPNVQSSIGVTFEHGSSSNVLDSNLASEEASLSDVVLSPKSVLRTVASMDEVASTTSDHVVIETHPYNVVDQENDSFNCQSREDRHSLRASSSLNSGPLMEIGVEEAQEQSTSSQNEANNHSPQN